MKRGFLVFMPLLLLLVPAAWAGITYQPDALPEVGFAYDPGEYLFRLTYRDYYLNIQPYAVYGGQAYTLKQIVPFIRAHYPGVEYRQAVQIFAKYHRWGFYLERLPAEVSSKLEEVGYRLVDTNIPRGWFEVEADPLLNVSRVTVGGRFTLDFSDLEARYDVVIDAEGVHVTGVTGLSDLDLDPITYSAPTITLTSGTYSFTDIYNADVAGGWGVVANNNGTGTQFEFNARIVVGDGTNGNCATLTDKNKQIVFLNNIIAARDYFIKVTTYSTMTIGEVVDAGKRITKSGCDFIVLESNYDQSRIIQSYYGVVNLYASSFTWAGSGLNGLTLMRMNDVWDCVFKRGVWIYTTTPTSVLDDLLFLGTPMAFETPSPQEINDVTVDGGYLIYFSSTGNIVFSNTKLIGGTRLATHYRTGNLYLLDCESNIWTFIYGGSSTGRVYRQYTFNLNVTGLNGAPTSGATVTLTRADGSTAFTATTAADGAIPEQTVTRGYYTKPTGDTLNDYGPFTLTVEADGYLPYEMVNINVNYPVNWSISLTALSLGLEFFSFIMVACAALYYGYTCGDADRSMVSFMFGFLFWLATMVQWFVDQAASPVIILGWVYVFPILLCVYEILMRATAQLDAGTKVNPFE